MSKEQELLLNRALKLGITLDEEKIKKFEIYSNTLLKWNNVMNLTTIVEKDEIILKHFIDSLTILLCTNIKDDFKVIDIGTGAGFPGIPIKIVNSKIELTLLDSLNKRINFLKELLKELNLNAVCIHGRAEQIAEKENFREKFDIVTSRAVASLPALCEYCLPFARIGGYFISLKGPNVYNEVENSGNAIKILGGELIDIKSFNVDSKLKRYAVVIKKVKKTIDKYPRKSIKISKKPL